MGGKKLYDSGNLRIVVKNKRRENFEPVLKIIVKVVTPHNYVAK